MRAGRRLHFVIAIIADSLIMGLWGMLFAIPTVVVVKTAVTTFFKELKDYRIIRYGLPDLANARQALPRLIWFFRV
jgi:predicted PurR-regulated permease PerM